MKKQYDKKITMILVNEQTDHKHIIYKHTIRNTSRELGKQETSKKVRDTIRNIFFTNLISRIY